VRARRVLWEMRRRVRRLWIPRRVRRLWWALRMQANEGVCSVEIANKHVGFFAQMVWCLYIFQHCERHGLIPDIRLTGDAYRDPNRGPNWLDYYFDTCKPMAPDETARRIRYTKKITEWEDMGQPFGADMSIDDAARILHKFIRPKSHIGKIVDEFWETCGTDGAVVGIHYRGTDKSSEAPRVSWSHCLATLETHLRDRPDVRAVFVASDEEAFIRFIARSVKDRPVYWRDDHYRSSDGRPVHTTVGEVGGYEKGEDALVNALLLAKCSTLIRTTSFLSAWASIFNPTLKVILLNKPYEDKIWYPESAIFMSRDTEYFPETALAD
jgi:hypothetical protein